jgi:hypothetical protein
LEVALIFDLAYSSGGFQLPLTALFGGAKRISFAFLVERQWTPAFGWLGDVEGDLP